jgi:hypothetical protein
MTARDHAENSGVATLGDLGLQGGSDLFALVPGACRGARLDVGQCWPYCTDLLCAFWGEVERDRGALLVDEQVRPKMRVPLGTTTE